MIIYYCIAQLWGGGKYWQIWNHCHLPIFYLNTNSIHPITKCDSLKVIHQISPSVLMANIILRFTKVSPPQICAIRYFQLNISYSSFLFTKITKNTIQALSVVNRNTLQNHPPLQLLKVNSSCSICTKAIGIYARLLLCWDYLTVAYFSKSHLVLLWLKHSFDRTPKAPMMKYIVFHKEDN